MAGLINLRLLTDFFNKIGSKRDIYANTLGSMFVLRCSHEIRFRVPA